MGLDHGLIKKFYVRNYEFTKPEEKHEVVVKFGGEIRADIPADKVSSISCEVIDWRKANAIHQWFVENVQDGEDDCKEYYVTEDQLRELYNVCCLILEKCSLIDGKVLDRTTFTKDANGNLIEEDQYDDGKIVDYPEICQELLPSQSGFFFGHTDYDEYYYRNILETKEMLEKELAIENNRADYYYWSSW